MIQICGNETMKQLTILNSSTEHDHLQLTKKLTGYEFDALTPVGWARLDAPPKDFTYSGEHGKFTLLAGGDRHHATA